MLTNTVADEVTDDSAAERFGIGLHGMPDIRDPASLAREFHALEKARFVTSISLCASGEIFPQA